MEIQIKIKFTVALNNVKYFDINLMTYVQDLHTENYEILLREIQGDLNKWMDISC